MRLLNRLIFSALVSLHCTAASASARSPIFTWKAVLVAGDDSAPVFDNARVELGRELMLQGIDPDNLIDLSASEEEKDTYDATEANLRFALHRLNVGPGDACLVHLTSHGTQDGFEMAVDPPLTPETLDSILEEGCGEAPTVVLVSACYSGIFTSPVMEKPNRIILTAARDDRPSFGCDARNEYTFWDECLLKHFPTSRSWRALGDNLDSCIKTLEAQVHEKRSFPQAFFGEQAGRLPMPREAWPKTDPETLLPALWETAGACYAIRKPHPNYFADDVCE